MKKVITLILILLNIMVLLGQIWPEGAPPFAKIVNITFLVGSLMFLIYHILQNKSNIK
ncbi:MAG: hypothetical protein HRT73_02545 [Flavobacteriales bacterium]|nr:hypothetical protein [Flavobacteriales bacterium]